jgi:hypothetical protein
MIPVLASASSLCFDLRDHGLGKIFGAKIEKLESDGLATFGIAYWRASSARFVFRDPGFEAGEEDSFAVEFFL